MNTLYMLAAVCLFGQDPACPAGDSAPAAAPANKAGPLGFPKPAPPLPMPAAAPLDLRLRATTRVFFMPIPMPLDILADPVPGYYGGVRNYRAMTGRHIFLPRHNVMQITPLPPH